ncbi:M48 family metallopeptidase [Clostridium sp. YIM B02515]|uniref:M48 family metallopeptidase n=1 Tax=Clostridium rhizosphaerae TaxID=2803861 RepID=A0ABS1THG5_9CLOT|nr:YgjP-like metallopeptidase domain-containing protein [Clostridium rhizosphaerae]MBL4937789.1 M48 family metallopeptidase [Clostridium rhizosphaerae]
MQLTLSGIPIEVEKKAIKNLHLYVKPPYGNVVISAPLTMNDKAIEMFARTNLSWIKKQISKYEEQSRSSKRQYVSGETLYIWGKQYFLYFEENRSKNSFEIHGNKVVLSMRAESTVKQRESFVREQYRAMLQAEIKRLLPKWEELTNLHCDSWQTKYMITKWGTCNTDKKKLWFNLQLVQKPIECLDYIILHELIHLRERTHNAIFSAYMNLYMPNWRELRKTLNDSKLDYYEQYEKSALHKLIDQTRFNDIKDSILEYLANESSISKSADAADLEIENVLHIDQPQEGYITFDVIVSCDIEKLSSKSGKSSFTEKWFSVHCQLSVATELKDFTVLCVDACEAQEEADNDSFSDELVPIITRDKFEEEANKFLTKYYPQALCQSVPVPIREIARDQMNLNIVENVHLSEELSIFGLIAFEDGKIYGKNRKILIKDAQRGTMYIDPRVYYERTLGTVNSTIAHECFHWYRHQPYHILMNIIGSNDRIGKNIKCSIETNVKDSGKWKAIDWMEWQANGIAMHILMPSKTAKIKIEQLFREYNICLNEGKNIENIELVIDELSRFYGISRQAVKIRMQELGYAIVDGAYNYVNGRYIPHFTFKAEAIGRNQTFTISAADLFKAYCFNPTFRKIIDSGKVVYLDGHLCINRPEYIHIDDIGIAHMSSYALDHVDECCLLFNVGYTYESKYHDQANYSYFLTKAVLQPSGVEYSFVMTDYNRALLEQIQNAPKQSNAMRRYPGSFAETLVQLMKEQKMSNKELANASLVGEKTIQRLRNDEEYSTTIQSVLGLCIGLKLSLPEAEMLLDKSNIKLNSMKTEGYIYKCILGACAINNIYQINEMLEAYNIQPLGSTSYD